MRRDLILLLVSLALISALLVFAAGTNGASGSVLSNGPNGFSALRAAVENLGREVDLLDRPFTDSEATSQLADSVLVISFPWQRGGERASPGAIEQHRLDGNPVVITYSGGALAIAEEELLSGLGFDLVDSFGFGPLNPLEWRRHLKEPQPLSNRLGSSTDASGGVVSTQRLRRTPEESLRYQPGIDVLLWDEDGRPIALRRTQETHRGALYLLPASVLSNAYLGHEGNARWLLALAEQLPRRWVFDEYHHGLIAANVQDDEPTRAFDAVALQLGLLYLLALLALGRRFAPPWPELPVHASNHRDFLEGIGMLHARMGHEGAARATLLERFERYDPNLQVSEAMRALARGPVEDEAAAFLDLARQLSQHREPES